MRDVEIPKSLALWCESSADSEAIIRLCDGQPMSISMVSGFFAGMSRIKIIDRIADKLAKIGVTKRDIVALFDLPEGSRTVSSYSSLVMTKQGVRFLTNVYFFGIAPLDKKFVGERNCMALTIEKIRAKDEANG